MAPRHTIGRLHALPTAREFELHTETGDVIYGRISDDIFTDALQQFNGTGALCSCIITGNPPVLQSIGAA